METVEKEFARGLDQLEGFNIGSKEYSIAVANLKELNGLKPVPPKKEPWFKIQLNPDIVVSAVANIIGIVLILNFEKVDVVKSKAIGFVKKL